MPANIIGIDVDGYDDKPGVFVMKATAERHGRLPETYVSTSRTGFSGIRWFRLPEPMKLPGKLVHPDDPNQSGVEVIQQHHRFAVVPPSIHPTGNPYQWITPNGERKTDSYFTPGDLPQLPDEWLNHIRQTCDCYTRFNWDDYKHSSNPVKDAYEKHTAKLNEAYGRHEAALEGTMALAGFELRGWPDATKYIQQLEADFYRACGDSRTETEARLEWERMLDGARTKAPSTTVPQWQDNYTPPAPQTPAEIDQAVSDELTRLRVREEARRLFQREQNPRLEPPPIQPLTRLLTTDFPDVRWRIDGWQPSGTRVLLAAQYKAGKTTLTGNLARCLADGDLWLGGHAVQPATGTVTILDFEMGERQIAEWLRDQGIKNTEQIAIAALRGKASSFDILDDKIRSEWAQRLAGTEYLIFDCVRPVLDALGMDEHKEAGQFLTAYDEMMDEAGISDSLVVHHMGHTGERARGDSRFRDWPDVEWRLVRKDQDPSSKRFITAFGRDVNIVESGLGYDDQTRHIVLEGGSRQDDEHLEILPDIIDWISDYMRRQQEKPNKNQTARAIAGQEGMPGRDKVIAAINYGIEHGKISLEIASRTNAHLLSSYPALPESKNQ